MLYPIERVVAIGDSLSDRGTMAKSALERFSGLQGNSPHGRFTNGYVWLDYFIAWLLGRKITGFQISDDEHVGTHDLPDVVRTYCKGGMTAHDYSTQPRLGQFVLNVESMVLATLKSMREEVLQFDEDTGIDSESKQQTLVVEWSGANDLITINHEPTKEAAALAVLARMTNLDELAAKGYCHFVLFNLPDLSLTPRFQIQKAHLINQTREVVDYFNLELQQAINTWCSKHPTCTVQLFDANQLFVDAYQNPEKYDLAADKKHQPFIESPDFVNSDSSVAAEGYMFWDEVHPMNRLHVELAAHFQTEVFSKHYRFVPSNESLVQKFREAYALKWDQDCRGCFGFFKQSRINYRRSDLTVDEIIHHALHNGGHRTRSVIRQLGWVDEQGQCANNHPRIHAAVNGARPKAQDESANYQAVSLEIEATSAQI